MRSDEEELQVGFICLFICKEASINEVLAVLRLVLCRSMVFSANDSPLAGRAGKAVTGRAIGSRLGLEAESSVSLHVTPLAESTEKYEVQVSPTYRSYEGSTLL